MANRFEKSTFQNTSVMLDHVEFDQCTFRNCKLVYAAEGVASMRDCSMYDCTWEFTGPAERTIQFLAALYAMGGGARELIEGTFNNIREGHYPGGTPNVH